MNHSLYQDGILKALPFKRLPWEVPCGHGFIDNLYLTAYVHETDRHFHQSGHLRFNHSRHFVRATAGPAPWGGACRWRLT
jgi:hypothetical protein